MAASPDELDRRLSVHEAVCAERYQIILSRMGRVERVIIVVSGTLIVGMAGLVTKLLSVLGRFDGI
jgi:hypothetical protein